MSLARMRACWPLRMPASAKSVLIVLADMADDNGECWPSIDTIAVRTCLHRATVMRSIEVLESLGHVTADRSNGRHTRYVVDPKMSPDTAPEPVAQCNGSHEVTGSTVQPDRSHGATQPVAQCDTNPQEPSRTLKAATASPIDASPHDTKARLFREWKALTDGGGGGFLNRVLRDHKPESAVLDAVARTLSEPRNDPKAFLLGCLRKGADDEFDPALGMTRGEHRRMFDPKIATPLDDYLAGRMSA